MGLDGIKIIEGKRGCGMALSVLDLTERLMRSKSVKSVGVFRLGSFGFYDKEEFLKNQHKALGGKG